MIQNHKPKKGEYPIFYKGYIDTLEDAPLIETLKKEKAYALRCFRNIPDDKSDFRYAEGKWTVKQVLIHIIDTEMVFGYRGLAIARGEKQSLPGFDQNDYMSGVNPENTSLGELIQCFEHLRSANILLYEMLGGTELENEGTASGYKVKSSTIGYFIAGHCKYHVNILKDRYGI
ncbi:DinB family protein [Portibacter marinus]|uniref:DinB family protein n=1 Tax=Portibacter marinus TaxID=2898660 RepID=UPI001F3E5DCB|nr:DinB family protein [Portibacter marinus]